MKHFIAILLLTLGFFKSTGALAGAWVQPKGKGLLLATYQNYVSCQFWDKSGQLHDGPCFHQQTVNPFLEYGLTDVLTIGLNPFIRQITYVGQVNNTHFEDSEIFGKYLLWKNDYSAFSSQLTVNIPFFRELQPGLAQAAPFAVTGRQYYVDARLLYGTGGVFSPKTKSSWYADFQGSYQHFFNGAADDVHIDITTAWKSPQNLLELNFKVLNIITMNNPRSINQPNYNLITLVPSLLLWYTQSVGVQLGAYQDIFGTNVGRGTAPFLALWLRF